MGHELSDIGHNPENRQIQKKTKEASLDDFVLEKTIFNGIFEKDIRRVFIYKKAEQLAKAIHLITPAFSESLSLRNRIDAIAVGLVDAAASPPGAVRMVLSRELLALSSVLSIARTSGFLSPMNAEIIAHEAHSLLQEIASYEEPRLLLDETPTLSHIAKSVLSRKTENETIPNSATPYRTAASTPANPKGHIKDTEHLKDRRQTILSVIKNKQKASIKDISTLIRDVSEKTIQRELSILIEEGTVLKQGERRWSIYSLAN
jgi:DNA-binding transcriptional ArsR family regulator